jgi:hypothetical protein
MPSIFLLHLEEHDDRFSLRDRLHWAKTRRVLLIWPARKRVRLQVLDLKFLQFHARRLGAELGIVSRRAEVRAMAKALGIPAFAHLRQAQRRPWPAPPKRLPHSSRRIKRPVARRTRPLSPLSRLLFFFLGVLAVLSLLVLFLPRATLTLTPQTRLQQETFTLVASSIPDATQPALRLQPVEVEQIAEEDLKATQRIVVPLRKAQGMVRFTNLTTLSQTIPAGTVVYVPGDKPQRFITLNEAGLPPSAGQFVEVPVEAVEAGSQGNVPAQAIRAIEGPLALSLSVTNPQPTQGGDDVERLAITPQEVQALREQLLSQLRAQAIQEARQHLAEGDLLFPETLELAEVLEDQAQPPPETYPSRLHLRLRVRYRLWTLSGEALRPLLESRLNAALSAEDVPQADSLRYRLLTVEVENGEEPLRLRFSLDAQRRLLARLDTLEIFATLRGKASSQALQALRSLPLAEPPRLEIWPPFWPWVPLLPIQMTIRLLP